MAVIDTDIDLDHLDLDQNISAASIDIVINNYATVNDVNGHGAQVAGIIAAEKNDLAMHGVAYGATVLTVRADALCFPGYTPACGGFNDTDLADALDYAVAQGAGVKPEPRRHFPSIIRVHRCPVARSQSKTFTDK